MELQYGGLSSAQYVEKYFSYYDDMHTSLTTYVVMTTDYCVVHESRQTSEKPEVVPPPNMNYF